MEETVKQFKEVIDNILSVGDWESSIFLKQAAVKLRHLLLEVDKLSRIIAEQPTTITKDNDGVKISAANIPPGYVQVYILLYQIDGGNLGAWYENIKSLVNYSANKAIYKNKNHIEEFIRSKGDSMARSGYVVVNVKGSDFYNHDTPSLDIYSHELLDLKEGAIQLANIVEFVLANKQHYAIEGSELVLLE